MDPTPDNTPSILVIDDSPDTHRLITARLKAEGWVIRSATNARDGIDSISESPPTLILLDVDMPGMDGFEALRLLKADVSMFHIPVVIVSGHASLEDKVMGLELGAVDYVVKPFDFTELKARIRAALRTQRLMEMLAQRAHIDGLTGLWNRAHFNRRLQEQIAAARRTGGRMALALCDLDNFKSVNDTFGHPAGDSVLQRFGTLLAEMVRESDIACRFGGEEFVVILPGATAEQAASVMERIRAGIAAMRWKRHPERSITASFGIACADAATGWSAERCLTEADQALYLAKSNGRNRIEIATVKTVRMAG